MSTKFFNNIETTLMDKFHGIATAMANFDSQELENVKEIRILVGINIDDIFRHHNPQMFFTADSHPGEEVEQYRQQLVADIRKAHYDADTEHGIMQMFDEYYNINVRRHHTSYK